SAELGLPRRRPHQSAEQPRSSRPQQALVPTRTRAVSPAHRSEGKGNRRPRRAIGQTMKAFLLIVAAWLPMPVVLAQQPDRDLPETEFASFKLPPGFEINLFASERDGVMKPIQMRWDARGRLWVIGSTTYPQIKPGEVPNDKVWILEDTKRGGYADKVTVF